MNVRPQFQFVADGVSPRFWMWAKGHANRPAQRRWIAINGSTIPTAARSRSGNTTSLRSTRSLSSTTARQTLPYSSQHQDEQDDQRSDPSATPLSTPSDPSIVNQQQAQTPSPSVQSSARGPLHGITVVSLEQAIAGPLCSRHLADLGARVIKIERPGEGDFARVYDTRVNGLCSHFAWVNRSKESLALDLKDPEDLAVLKKLCERVDVLVQNLAPGATARMGLSYEELSKTNPGIIVADISGYGSDGPYVQKKAYDLLIQAEAGFLSVTGTTSKAPDGTDSTSIPTSSSSSPNPNPAPSESQSPTPSSTVFTPVKAGISIADISAGTYAYSSILASLFARTHNGGIGCRLDVSMLETMAEWMMFPMYYAYEGQAPPPAAGAEHSSIYPYGPFKCGGNVAGSSGDSAGTSAGDTSGMVMLGIQNDREWLSFCKTVLQSRTFAFDPRFRTSASRSENRAALRAAIESSDAFTMSTPTQLTSLLDGAGIANSIINSVADLWAHPQLQARGRFTSFPSEVGRIATLKPPAHAAEWGVVMNRLPAVNEDGIKIRRELEKAVGVGREKIGSMSGAGEEVQVQQRY